MNNTDLKKTRADGTARRDWLLSLGCMSRDQRRGLIKTSAVSFSVT